MKFIWLLVSCLVSVASVVSAVAQNNTGWNLVWSDEFNLPNGSSPDTNKWANDIGAGGWGNAELEYYTARTNNSRIENGQLVAPPYPGIGLDVDEDALNRYRIKT